MPRILAAAVLCLSLAACTLGFQGKIDPQVVETFRLERIDVSVAPNATFWWGDGERAYARSIGRAEHESEALASTPEARAFMHRLAAERIKAAFDREFAGRMREGSRLVRIQVVMNNINIASPIQRILVGGGHSMRAGVNLVDAKTGQVIAANPELSSGSQAGQGLLGTAIDSAIGSEPVDRVATNLASSYRNWLLQN